MPIYRLLQGEAFDPEHIQAMGTAFETALKTLGLTDRADPLTDTVAKKIVVLGQQGVRDAQRLHDLTITALT